MNRAWRLLVPWMVGAMLLGGPAFASRGSTDPPAFEPRPVFTLLIGQPFAPNLPELRAVHSDVAMMHAFFGTLTPRHSYVHMPPSDVRADLVDETTTVAAPTWPAIEASLEAIEAAVDALGGEADVYIYYAGHGRKRRVGAHTRTDLFLQPLPDADGPGTDGILTTRLLQQRVLARLDRTHSRVHLIVDACQSTFLLEARGMRLTKRVIKAPPRIDQGMLDEFTGRYRTVGALLATSGSQATYESAASGGVFSYAVRSAGIGAADLDGDGRITYSELSRVLPSILSKRAGGAVPRLVAPGGREDETFVDYRGREAARVTFAPPRATRYELQTRHFEPYAALYPTGDAPAVVFLPSRTEFLARVEVPETGPRVWYRFQAMSRGFEAIQQRYDDPGRAARMADGSDAPPLVMTQPLATDTLVPVEEPEWVWLPESYATLAVSGLTEASLTGRTLSTALTSFSMGGEVTGTIGSGAHQFDWRVGYTRRSLAEPYTASASDIAKNADLAGLHITERSGHLARAAVGYSHVLLEESLLELSAGVFGGYGMLFEQRRERGETTSTKPEEFRINVFEGGVGLHARILLPDLSWAIRADLRISAQGVLDEEQPYADVISGGTLGVEYEWPID